MVVVADTWFQTLRHLRTEIRIPIWIFVSLTQPVIWLLLFTQVFRSVSDLPGLGTSSYLQFFTPGVVVMTVMFGAAWSGMAMLTDIDMGILSKMLATPVTRISIIMSRIVASTITLVVQALIIFTLAIISGVDLATGGLGVLVSIALLSLLGIGFAGISIGLALLLRRQESMVAMINFVTLPTMFLSSTMMAPDLLPDWLNTVRQVNPIDYAVVGVRNLVLTGYVWSDLWLSTVVLTAWATFGVLFGTQMLRAKAHLVH